MSNFEPHPDGGLIDRDADIAGQKVQDVIPPVKDQAMLDAEAAADAQKAADDQAEADTKAKVKADSVADIAAHAATEARAKADELKVALTDEPSDEELDAVKAAEQEVDTKSLAAEGRAKFEASR